MANTNTGAATNNNKVGLLFKRSDFLKEWKPRHFVLAGPQLKYCLPESPQRVHKSLDLTMCKITEGSLVHWNGHVLHTLVVSKPGAGVSYTLGALRKEDATAWVAALKASARDATRNFYRVYQEQQQAGRDPQASIERIAINPSPSPSPSTTVTTTTTTTATRSSSPLTTTSPPSVREQPVKAASPTLERSRETRTEYLVFFLPSVCYAALRFAPERLYQLRGLAFLTSLAIILYQNREFPAKQD